MEVEKPRGRYWSLKEYLQLGEVGLFLNQQVELIEGVIIRMPPQSNFHGIAIDLSQQALQRAFGTGCWVRNQLPLHLSKRSAPEPDLAVVLGTSRDYVTRGTPTT